MSRAEELAKILRESAAMHANLDHHETDEWQAADLLTRYAALERAARELVEAEKLPYDDDAAAFSEWQSRTSSAWNSLRAAVADLEK